MPDAQKVKKNRISKFWEGSKNNIKIGRLKFLVIENPPFPQKNVKSAPGCHLAFVQTAIFASLRTHSVQPIALDMSAYFNFQDRCWNCYFNLKSAVQFVLELLSSPKIRLNDDTNSYSKNNQRIQS